MTSYCDFTIRAGGNNTYAGTTSGSGEESASLNTTLNNGASGWVGGAFVNSTRVFTVAGGNPSTAGIVAGMFASIFTAGATATGCVARVTAVSATTITLSGVVFAGTIPANGTYTLIIGGAWLGPNTTDGMFPWTNLTLMNALTTITTSFPARINFKNNQTYNVAAGVTYAGAGPCTFSGYTTTFADGGKATIDGGTSGASYTLLTLSVAAGQGPDFRNFIFQNNGATGSAAGIILSTSARHLLVGCVFHDFQGAGLSTSAAGVVILVECEAYNCNKSNTASLAAFVLALSSIYMDRCFIHDNTGSNTRGLISTNGTVLIMLNCIFSGNGLHGVDTGVNGVCLVVGCDFYNNGVSAALGSGFFHNSNAACAFRIENCNGVLNTGFGFRFTVATTNQVGDITNCGFGSGSQANTSGDIDRTDLGALQETGTVTYASGVTPWNNPANGDFSITLAAAQYAGRGKFTETSAGLSAPNTVGFPDIGAAMHKAVGGGGGLFVHPGMIGGMHG